MRPNKTWIAALLFLRCGMVVGGPDAFAAQNTIGTADELGMTISAAGALESLSAGDENLLPGDLGGFYPVSICDVAQGDQFLPVSGHRGRGFSIYVDLYYTDGTAKYGNIIDWQTGTTDWQYGIMTIEPAKPIRNVNVYLLLRGHAGTVWFDDIFVTEAP